VGADDFPAALAAEYGYVNRVVPDEELDGFVDAFARRIAGFDKTAVAKTKALVDDGSLPPDEEFAASLDAFFQTSGRPQSADRVRALFERGLQQPDGVERDLGRHVGDHSSR
jgi:enoyl-CoA hydratase/carnithine racemase